jgi:DnaJ family protein C protein 7
MHSKRQRYDSGVDLQDPEDMFGGGFGGMPGGAMNIDPAMLFNMMGGSGGSGFSFSPGPGGFGGMGGMPGGGGRGGGFHGGGYPF